MRCPVVFAPLTLVLLACAGNNSNAAAPVIDQFSASPTSLPTDGGVVTLAWETTGASSLALDPGALALTPVAAGSKTFNVVSSTTFTLTATAAANSVTKTATVTVSCDSSPGTLSGTCDVPTAGQCVDFASLSTLDANSLPSYCASLGGQWSNTACPATNRIGTCQVPPADPNTGLHCSPVGSILERYYSSNYDLGSAQAACAGAPGTTFTQG